MIFVLVPRRASRPLREAPRRLEVLELETYPPERGEYVLQFPACPFVVYIHIRLYYWNILLYIGNMLPLMYTGFIAKDPSILH